MPSAPSPSGRRPARVSQYAVERPTRPPPTTTVPASSGWSPRVSQSEGALANQDAPSIDVEDLAGDVPGERGGEEEHGAGDILGSGDTAERDRGESRLAPLPRQGVGGHLGVHPAGSDGVDPDPGGELGGPRLGGGDQRPLARRIGAVEGLAALAGGGADVEDGGVLGAGEQRNRAAGAEEGAHDVDGERRPQPLGLEVRQRIVDPDAG